MFERWTSEGRRILTLAQEQVRDLGHNYVGTEHLLLGIITAGEGAAIQILQRLGTDLDMLRRDVVAALDRDITPPHGHIPFTPAAKRVLESASQEAFGLGHDAVGSAHLLLALVADGTGVAGQALANARISAPSVRDLVLDLAGTEDGEPWLQNRSDVDRGWRDEPGTRPGPDRLYQRLQATAAIINRRAGVDSHDVVLVLGSGLGAYPDRFADAISIPYGELPGFPRPGAVGHAGVAYSVRMGENRVLLLAGRVHAYEGHPMDVVTFPIRAAILAGCRKVILTNAAGGCGDGLAPGDLVLISDHINMAGLSPLAGPNDERLGPRFPDMTDVYTPALRDAARDAGGRAGVSLGEGVYMWWRGPMFETPAEIRMARALGASLVGMSTVPEATAARHMGADILGISLVTNLAAGMSGQRLTSEEVIETADEAAGRFAALFDELLPVL